MAGVTISQLKELLASKKEEGKEENIKGNIKSKTYKGTKLIIVGIVVFLAIIGFLGSTHWGIFAEFSMDDFTQFIKSYGGIFMMLTGMIGGGGAVKNGIKALADYKKTIAGAVEEETTAKADDGESIVKGNK